MDETESAIAKLYNDYELSPVQAQQVIDQLPEVQDINYASSAHTATDIKLAPVLEQKAASQRYGYTPSQIGQAKANLVRAKRAGKKLEKKLRAQLRRSANQESTT